jgi:dTDP-4-amino-4,6-dideoxygalactose transaminase
VPSIALAQNDVMTTNITIPVARPLLPTADQFLPYLREIDRRRVYSNFGPLSDRLEARLADFLGLGEGCVVSAGNATAALAAVLLASADQSRSHCLLPSWTFCASAHAVRLAGLEPFFLDVDPVTWQLTPHAADKAIREGLPVAAVMVVAPFGSPVDVSAWESFEQRTGVPVVIDAAAAFAAQHAGRTPIVVSLHATKILGVGEGAFVATRAQDVAEKVRHIMNFGFLASRVVAHPGMNGKLSEVGAAIGLAALDEWPRTKERWRLLLALYYEELRRGCPSIRLARPLEAISSTLVAEFDVSVEPLIHALAARGIDSRRWWNFGCHREPAFSDCGRQHLPITERLAQHTLGLPLYVDMSTEEIRRVVLALKSAL